MQSHVATFHKAASNWTRRIFRDIAVTEGMNIWVDRPNDSPINQNVEVGADDTLSIYIAGNREAYNARAEKGEPTILCVRDPKDIVVSQYFSWLHSHANNSENLLAVRGELQALSVSDGIRLLIDRDVVSMCKAALGWEDLISSGEAQLLKYEDLVADFSGALGTAGATLGVNLDDDYLAELKERYSFKALSKREPGDEKPEAHYRKGIPGDWVNYFDGELSARFNEQYGAACDLLGYERAPA